MAFEAIGGRGSVSRPRLIIALYLLAVINGLVADVVRSIVAQGFWPAAFGTFDVSIVVVAACAIGAGLMAQAPDRAMDRADYAWIFLCGLLILVPHRAGSWIGLTLLALYEAARARGSRHALAAATIFAAIAVNKFWGALLVQVFAVPLFKIDAAMAAGVLALISGDAVGRDGNIIHTGHDEALVVATGCSSVAGMSAALLCWITIIRALRPQWWWSELPQAIFLCAAVAGLNVIRIALMGLGPEWLQIVHGPIGANVANIAILGIAAAIALGGTTPDSAPPHPAG
jgi:hypothetical protein